MGEKSSDNLEQVPHDERQRRAEPRFRNRSYASKKFRDYREAEFRGDGDKHFVEEGYRQPPGATAQDIHSVREKSRRPDSSIFASLSMKLSDDATIDASDIRISVNEGVVTLQGRLDSEYSKNVICEMASDISGVVRVEDSLIETDDEDFYENSQHSGSTGIKRSLLEENSS